MSEPYSDEGYRLVGAAFEVHNVQGGGLFEEIYQQSLEIELELREIPFRPKERMSVHYKGRALDKRYVPDLFVFDAIIVELKAVASLGSEHEAQLINYMRLASCPIGYLINFGPIGQLEYERFILSEFLRNH